MKRIVLIAYVVGYIFIKILIARMYTYLTPNCIYNIYFFTAKQDMYINN